MRCIRMVMAVAVIMAASAVLAQADTITYGFGRDDGSGDVMGPTLRDVNNTPGSEWLVQSASTVAEGYNYDLSFGPRDGLGDSDTYVLGEIPAENESLGCYLTGEFAWPDKQSGTHKTLWIESPAFQFGEGGSVNFWFQGNGQAAPLAWPLPEIAGTWLDDETKGMLGLGLFDMDTEQFVRTADITSDHGWQNVNWDVTGLDLGHSYSVMMVDQLAGDSGRIAMDYMVLTNATQVAPAAVRAVPEPGTMALLLAGLVGAAVVWFRKK